MDHIYTSYTHQLFSLDNIKTQGVWRRSQLLLQISFYQHMHAVHKSQKKADSA